MYNVTQVSFHTYMLHGHSATQCFQHVLTYDENILLQPFKNSSYKKNNLGNGNCSRKHHVSRICISTSLQCHLQKYTFIMKNITFNSGETETFEHV